MAKDIITRFKLETTGFDSKIKEAAKNLSAYSKTATQAKEGFNQFTKANVDAARALGTIATSTTNAKDRAKELVGALKAMLGIMAKVKLVAPKTITRSEGKAVRVIDKRKI